MRRAVGCPRAVPPVVRTGSICVVFAALVAGAVPAVARALPASSPRHVVQRATLGGVEADFVYTATGKPYPNGYESFGISIRRHGTVEVSASIGCHQCSPGGSALGKPTKSVRVVRLTPGSEPIVLVDLWTGGAHCCFRTDLYVWRGTAYRHVREDWGDPGYSLRDLGHDGSLEFLTADDRFAYAFTDYADSAMPVEVFVLRNGKLVDVTTRYPGVVRHDAATLWAAYLKAHKRHRPTRGLLAAWVADQARLGDLASAMATLERPQEIADIARDPTALVNATHYIAQLRSFLRKNDYG